jgi:pyridoxamine 5'-phosphate oxidase
VAGPEGWGHRPLAGESEATREEAPEGRSEATREEAQSHSESLAAMRVEYGSVEKDGSSDLDVDWLDKGWLALLRTWISEAEQAGVAEPNAMVLATVEAGRPVSRSVLCKNVDETGITFFTNYDSAKGAELAATPYACATFPWYALGRQVHIRGAVTKVSAEVTADYWSKRPRGSQLGAWASHQSHLVDSRAALLAQLADVTERFADTEQVPVPPNWGGYLIAPEIVEFWQGRESRLHNRIRMAGDRIERLQP